MKKTGGIITRASPYGVRETIDRLEVLLKKNGATIYARIDQQSEVRKSGREILAIEFLLFGNPSVGGAIMDFDPLAALDLPLKILAWENADNLVHVAYNDPNYIQSRYALPDELVLALNLAGVIDKALT